MLMIKLINILESVILTESILLSKIRTSDGKPVTIEYTLHTLLGQSSNSEFGRLNLDLIMESITNFIDVIYNVSIKTLSDCSGKKCAIIVRDILLEIDYHLWIKKTDNRLILTINTSIHHPKKLFNREKVKVIIINQDDTHNIIEIFNIMKNKIFIIKELYEKQSEIIT
jgi:hypothetical protein